MTIGYLFSRNGAAIKMHDHLDAALEHARSFLAAEHARPPEVEVMRYSRDRGWESTGERHFFYGPLVPDGFSRCAARRLA
jgi:hypothetical protein